MTRCCQHFYNNFFKVYIDKTVGLYKNDPLWNSYQEIRLIFRKDSFWNLYSEMLNICSKFAAWMTFVDALSSLFPSAGSIIGKIYWEIGEVLVLVLEKFLFKFIFWKVSLKHFIQSWFNYWSRKKLLRNWRSFSLQQTLPTRQR